MKKRVGKRSFRTKNTTFVSFIHWANNFAMRKKIRYIILAVLWIGAGVWVASRWDAWFSIPDEPFYLPKAVPERLMLTFGDESERSRNISWRCDTVLKNSAVELSLGNQQVQRIQAEGEIFESRSGKAAYYVCRLRGLMPDTVYRYRVCTGGTYSEWHTFRTYELDRNHFSFLYVGDVQDTDGASVNALLRRGLQAHQTEFMVCSGDLTERPSDNHWEDAFRALDSIAQNIPIIASTGNHDFLKNIPRKLEKRFPLVFSYFLDSMVGINQVYSLRYGQAELFVLDSNREVNYLWEQRQWLVEKLQASDANWKILILHHPLHSIKGAAYNLIQQWMFDDLVREYGVDLVLQGHEHAYARMSSLDEAGQKVTPVYVVSHCSPKHYRIEFNDKFDRYGISSRYYQVVKIAADTLSMSVYELDSNDLYDSIKIIKSGIGERGLVVDEALEIPENMSFSPRPNKKKDREYEERILEYMKEHPEKEFKR